MLSKETKKSHQHRYGEMTNSGPVSGQTRMQKTKKVPDYRSSLPKFSSE